MIRVTLISVGWIQCQRHENGPYHTLGNKLRLNKLCSTLDGNGTELSFLACINSPCGGVASDRGKNPFLGAC